MSTPAGPDFVLAPPPEPAPEPAPTGDQQGPKYLWLLVILLLIAALVGIAVVIAAWLFSQVNAQPQPTPQPVNPTGSDAPQNAPNPGPTPGPTSESEDANPNEPRQQARREVMDFGFVGVLAGWKVGVNSVPQSFADLTAVALSVKNYQATDRAPGESLAVVGSLPSGQTLNPVPCPSGAFDWASVVPPNTDRSGQVCFRVGAGQEPQLLVSVKHTGVPAGALHFRDS